MMIIYLSPSFQSRHKYLFDQMDDITLNPDKDQDSSQTSEEVHFNLSGHMIFLFQSMLCDGPYAPP